MATALGQRPKGLRAIYGNSCLIKPSSRSFLLNINGPQIFVKSSSRHPSSAEAARHGSIEATVLATQGTEETLVDELIEVFEGEMLGALAHLLHL